MTRHEGFRLDGSDQEFIVGHPCSRLQKAIGKLPIGELGRSVVKNAKQPIWRAVESLADLQQSGDGGGPPSAHVVRIAPFFEASSPASLGIRDAQLFGTHSEPFRDDLHGNRLFPTHPIPATNNW